MKKWLLWGFWAVCSLAPAMSYAAATSVDALIEKLVDKGILTKVEARELKMEIASDTKAISDDMAKSQIPEWVQNTKVKGDVRVRYQYERQKNDAEARSRGRVRLRLGLDSKINEQWNVGAGLASSEVEAASADNAVDDSRSTNMSFTDGFRRGNLLLPRNIGVEPKSRSVQRDTLVSFSDRSQARQG